jgi:feruloyl-CoA synthase
VCALAWLNAAEARKLLGEDPAPDGDLVSHPGLAEFLARALATHNEAAGSSARVERLLVMTRPAGLDAGEITDKGYVNQRTVLARRAALVELLYADPAPAGVIVAQRAARATRAAGPGLAAPRRARRWPCARRRSRWRPHR